EMQLSLKSFFKYSTQYSNMSDLFRKVMTADRLPEKDGQYLLTEFGWMFFHAQNDTQEWRFTKSMEDDEDWEFPGYWLEPVEPPTDEKIWQITLEQLPPPVYRFSQRMAFDKGFKKCLELIKGK
ncbi:MAG: hypothetical protein ACREHG_07380, partial [Candidatus Saccharimonadales bacterium]